MDKPQYSAVTMRVFGTGSETIYIFCGEQTRDEARGYQRTRIVEREICRGLAYLARARPIPAERVYRVRESAPSSTWSGVGCRRRNWPACFVAGPRRMAGNRS